MRGDAIYTVRENGDTTYFYGTTAGDYQSPLDALQCILNQKVHGYPAEVTMRQLIYNPDYPLDIVIYDPDEDPGESVFDQIDKKQADEVRSSCGQPVGCTIFLNLDQGTVSYIPNPFVKEAPVSELTIPIEECMLCYIAALSEAMMPAANSDYAEELNRLLGELLPVRAERWKRIKGHNAVYTVIEKGKASFFRTDFDGGYYNPGVVLRMIRKAGSELHRFGISSDCPYIMEGIQYTGAMINVDLELVGERMFEEIDSGKCRELLSKLKTADDIAMHVILNFDCQQVTLQCGRSLPEAAEEICVSFADVSECMSMAEYDADQMTEEPRPILLEKGMLRHLRVWTMLIGKTHNNFIEDCVTGGATTEDMDDYVGFWHEHETGNTLREFLGMSEAEYNLWVQQSDDIINIILDKRRNTES